MLKCTNTVSHSIDIKADLICFRQKRGRKCSLGVCHIVELPDLVIASHGIFVLAAPGLGPAVFLRLSAL